MSGENGQGTFAEIIADNFGYSEELQRVRAETAVDHYVELMMEGHGVVETGQDIGNCREAAEEDVVLLLGCSDEHARELVSAVVDTMVWERVTRKSAKRKPSDNGQT